MHTIKRGLLWLVLCAVCAALAGCAPGRDVMTVANIALPANPDSEYEWNHMISDTSILKETPVKALPEAGDAVALYACAFAAVSPGTAEVTFAYARSFENLEPASQVTYTFEVGSDGALRLIDATGTLSPIPDPIFTN